MPFSANPFDMTGTLDTSGIGLAPIVTKLSQFGTISGATVAAGVVTFTTGSTVQLTQGQAITITGVTGFSANNPNGTFIVNTIPSATTFTVIPALAPTGTYTSGGTIFWGTDQGNTSVASVCPAFNDATLAADAANRVLLGQITSPYISWH
jgi:hypothetical protein